VIYVGVIAVLGTAIVVIVPSVRGQAQELWAALPGMFERAQTRLVSVGLLREPLTLKEAFSRVPVTGSDAVDTLVNAASGVAGGIFGLFTIAILTFYLLLESSGLFESFVGLFPRPRRKDIRRASTEITGKISAWLIGQLMLMAIIGTSAAVGLGLLGVPYFYVLALIAGLGELIPVVGPILAAVPAVLVSLNESLQLAVWVAVFFIIQQQVENHVLVPKVMERQVGVSAVTVIVALLIGGALQGLLGAILAVPTAAILQVAIQHVTARTVKDSP
jgi:predicted PurR-regulated permease PerM